MSKISYASQIPQIINYINEFLVKKERNTVFLQYYPYVIPGHSTLEQKGDDIWTLEIMFAQPIKEKVIKPKSKVVQEEATLNKKDQMLMDDIRQELNKKITEHSNRIKTTTKASSLEYSLNEYQKLISKNSLESFLLEGALLPFINELQCLMEKLPQKEKINIVIKIRSDSVELTPYVSDTGFRHLKK